MQEKNLQHKKVQIGPLPIINQVLERLGIRDIFSKHISNSRYVEAIIIILENILLEPAALYRIPAWAKQFGIDELVGGSLGDDLLGRALDKLFCVDRATLLTQLTLETISAYEVDVSIIHNDSTSIKFYGAYKSQSPKAMKLKRGHSKDHRPDLKQIIFNLSITEDGSLPIHFKCFDGNRTDDTLHTETWLTLRGILGKSDFVYVADSKLCTSENMKKIDIEKGQFITIVPETRSETKTFSDQCYDSSVRWIHMTRKPSPRKKGKFDTIQVAEDFYQLKEGYRLFWYRSFEKKTRDKTSREDRIEIALEKLNDMQSEKRRGPKTRQSLLKAASKILDRYKVKSWIQVDVKMKECESFKKTKPGKPGPESTFKRTIKHVPCLVVQKNHEMIARSESIDGIFPLTTNTKFEAKKVWQLYKYQPFLEKRFCWMKSDYQIAPVFLKKTSRIESLMFICYMAHLVAGIIQRQLRKSMKDVGVSEIKTLPEGRSSETPTWEQIQRLFDHHSKYILKNGPDIIKIFWDELRPIQKQIIKLLNVPMIKFSEKN